MEKSFFARLWSISLFCLLFTLLMACSPPQTATPLPTQTLIPPTATPTPTPITPTATTEPGLFSPHEIAAITPTQTNTTASMLDPALVQRMVDDLAVYLGVDPTLIIPVAVQSVVWANSDLGCGAASERPILDQAVSGYRVQLLVGNRVYTYYRPGEADFRRCGGDAMLRGDLLVEVDPIAAEMVALAKRRVGQRLDLSTRRVQLLDVMRITWEDTSLGCPQENQEYSPTTIEGYRIVVMAAETAYIFHTDSVQLIPCTPEQEVLPALPE